MTVKSKLLFLQKLSVHVFFMENIIFEILNKQKITFYNMNFRFTYYTDKYDYSLAMLTSLY